MRTLIRGEKVIKDYRMEKKDFTREKKLPFWRVVILILSGWKRSIQNRLNKFFEELNMLDDVPSVSALCQARQKIKPEFFKDLNENTVKFFYEKYEEAGLVKRWNEKFLYALDGSRINLPNSEGSRERYSNQTNQHDEKGVCQGLSSFLYDVLNEITINTEIDKNKGEKVFIFDSHKNHYREDSVVLYDRGYADYSVIAYHIKQKIGFIIRCPIKNTFKEVEKFIKSEEFDGEVKIEVTDKQREIVKKEKLPEEVKIRVIKVILDNGEMEILLTGLMDKKVYKTEDFGEAYNYRWGVETYFDRLKNQLEIERFSFGKVNNIEQDFYGIVFLSTLESVLSKQEEKAIKDTCQEKGRKYEYKLNKSVSYTAILDHVVEIFLNSDTSSSEVIEKLRKIFKTSLSPIRPGRKVNRKELSESKKLRFHRYGKKIIA